ncbi:MAG: hypothetical protein Q8O32_00020, partial [bacterium]|nr:hypothetical protein [bacterium]
MNIKHLEGQPPDNQVDARDQGKDNLDELGEFLIIKDSEEIKKEWQENYYDNPSDFFSENNLLGLNEQYQSKRLALLARASLYLTVTPDMANKYFKYFPEDVQVLTDLFCNHREGIAYDGLEFQLFSIAAQQIEKNISVAPVNHKPEVSPIVRFPQLEKYLEIAERRNIAPQLLLENGIFYMPENFTKLGKVSDDYFGVLKEASDLNFGGDHFLQVDPMFGENFESLSDEEKIEFLKMALVNIHYNMLSNEVYNSCFTRERVTADRGRIRGHNVAHSMIFRTFQDSSVYNIDQGNFEYRMNSSAEIGGAVEEYADHRIVLAILDKMKDTSVNQEQTIGLLVDFLDKSRNPIFSNALAEAFNNLGVNVSAEKLLKLLQKNKGDNNHTSAMLYRLEFGNIGISSAGVKYLEKMYDLGELNNPNYFAQRLTARGDVGIFDNSRILVKFFNLGKMSDDEVTVKPKIHDFIYSTLFLEHKDETSEQRVEREKYLKEFKESYFNFYDDAFFKETNVKFNNLDFREQGWFLIYYKHSDQNQRSKLINFVKKFGEKG